MARAAAAVGRRPDSAPAPRSPSSPYSQTVSSVVAVRVAHLDREQPPLVGVGAHDHRRPHERPDREGLGRAERHSRIAIDRPPRPRPVDPRPQRRRPRDPPGRQPAQAGDRLLALAPQPLRERRSPGRPDRPGRVQRRRLQARPALQDDPARTAPPTTAPPSGNRRSTPPSFPRTGSRPSDRRRTRRYWPAPTAAPPAGPSAPSCRRRPRRRSSNPGCASHPSAPSRKLTVTTTRPCSRRQPRRVVVGPRPDREGPAVQIDHHRPRPLAGLGRRRIDIDEQTVLGPDHEPAAPAQDRLPPQGLGAVRPRSASHRVRPSHASAGRGAAPAQIPDRRPSHRARRGRP